MPKKKKESAPAKPDRLNGRNALNFALGFGQEATDAAAVNLVLGIEGLDLNRPWNEHGHTYLLTQCADGRSRNVRRLLDDARADPNQAAKAGTTPLIAAANEGHHRVIAMLLEDQRSDVNLVDKEGNSPLLVAAARGFHLCVELLLGDPRTDPNVAEKNQKRTALHLASVSGYARCVELLLADARVDLDQR